MTNKKVLIPLICAIVAIAAVLIVLLVIKPGNGKSSSDKKNVTAAEGLDAIEEKLISEGVVDKSNRKELDPTIFKCEKAVEFKGEVTIIAYNKDSEGFELASKDELKDSDGNYIGFQGYINRNDHCYCYFYDYSDYEGAHNIDWQKKFGDTFTSYKGG